MVQTFKWLYLNLLKIICVFIFFLFVTPLGVMLRTINKGRLIKLDSNRTSYWITRN